MLTMQEFGSVPNCLDNGGRKLPVIVTGKETTYWKYGQTVIWRLPAQPHTDKNHPVTSVSNSATPATRISLRETAGNIFAGSCLSRYHFI